MGSIVFIGFRFEHRIVWRKLRVNQAPVQFVKKLLIRVVFAMTPSMLAKLIQSLIRYCAILSISLCALSSVAQTVTYFESNSRVVFEVENHAAVSPWSFESSTSGYTGTGYFRGGEDHFNNPGVGVLSFCIQIQNSGRYQLNWRNRIGFGTNAHDFNDSWARMTDDNGDGWDTFDGANISVGDQWHKVYVTTASGWNYGSSNHDSNQVPLAWDLVAGETYYFEISARSKDHLVDRVVLWDQNTYDYASEATGKEFGNTLSVLDALAESSTSVVVDPPDPDDIKVLFIRAGSGTTVLFGGASSDITDSSTSGGNSGWGSLASMLDANGFDTSQLIEGPST